MEVHAVAFTMAGFRAGLEKTNDSERTVGCVEHLPAHRLGGGNARWRSEFRHLQALRPNPQDNRALHRTREWDPRLVNLDQRTVSLPVEQIDRRRADEAGDELSVGTLV